MPNSKNGTFHKQSVAACKSCHALFLKRDSITADLSYNPFLRTPNSAHDYAKQVPHDYKYYTNTNENRHTREPYSLPSNLFRYTNYTSSELPKSQYFHCYNWYNRYCYYNNRCYFR